MRALADLLRAETENEAWRLYMAECSRGLLMAWRKDAKDFPSWRDIISEKKAPPEQTGEEIIDGIFAQALGG